MLRCYIYTLLIIAALLYACSYVNAQTAKVITLSDADAQTAKRLYDEAQQAQAAYDKFKTSITVRYVLHGTMSTSREWSGGFEFSEDFKAIVPKAFTFTTGTFTIGDPCTRYSDATHSLTTNRLAYPTP